MDSGSNLVYSKAKIACVKCRERKVKCTGLFPCRNCTLSGYTCSYQNKPRRPKKIAILDTEVESLQSRIKELESQLKDLQVENHHPSQSLGEYPEEAQNLELSLFIGSGASELVCYNLYRWSCEVNETDTTVTPGFSSLIEESVYDSHMQVKDSLTKLSDILVYLLQYTISDIENYLDSILENTHCGFLPLDYNNFIDKIHLNCVGNDGSLRIPDSDVECHYFACKVLMVTALGEVVTFESKPTDSLIIPGLKPYQLVMSYLPPAFQILTISHQSVSETFEAIELLGLIAIYIRCFDKKNRSAMVTMNALELCIALNLHKKSLYAPLLKKERYDLLQIFWSTFLLNRFTSCRIGQPVMLRFHEIESEIPNGFKETKYCTPQMTKFNIELSKIAEEIINDIYTSRSPADNKLYLRAILSTLQKLITLNESMPSITGINLGSNVLDLRVPKMILDNNSHLLRTLLRVHLNYHHHIYLTCIPILLHLSKLSIASFHNPEKFHFTMEYDKLPVSISDALKTSVKSTCITIRILLIFHRMGRLKTFDFSELDYLCSSAVTLINYLLLRFDFDLSPNEQLDSSAVVLRLELTVELILEMSLNGNAIAKGKLKQIISLISDLMPLFNSFGNEKITESLERLCMSSSSQNQIQDTKFKKGYSPSPVAEIAEIDITENLPNPFQFSEEDVHLFNEMLNDFN